jgi:branched-chain amino acid transport system substrate-binding protein
LSRPTWRWPLIVMGAALLAAGCASNASPTTAGTSTSGPVVIGASMALSGQTVLTTIRLGYQLAVHDVNAAGGIKIGGTKHKVELQVLDNRSDTSTMLQQVRTLVLTDHVAALLGSCCQQNIDMEGQADALKIPLVMGALPVELLPKGNGYTWDAFQSLTAGAVDFYQVAAKAGTNKKVLIVTDNDAQGLATAQLWSHLAKAAGFTVAATKAVPTGTTDFSNVIQAAQAGKAQVLVASMVPPDCFAMWKQMKALAYQPKIAIGVQCAQTPGWASLGALGNGTLLQMNWTPTAGLPKTAEIISKFSKAYPNANDLASIALGYNAASVLLNAISRAGSTDPAAINKALASTSMSSALGPIKFTGNKSVTPSFIGQWENGSIDQVWPAKGAAPLKSLTGLG